MSRRKRNSNAEKHQYKPSDIHYSSGWVTEDFRLADKQRQIERDQRKQENCKALGALYDIIETENVVSLAHFVRLVYSSYPQLVEVYVHNHQHIRDYIASRRYDISCGFVDMPYNKVCELLENAQKENSELQSKCGDYILRQNSDFKKIRDLETKVKTLQGGLLHQSELVQTLLKRTHEYEEMLSFIDDIPVNSGK